jgi:DNA-binding transcriptional regulator YhcF (GntR family)
MNSNSVLAQCQSRLAARYRGVVSAALTIAVDRDADVPVGTQLAWALRSGILGGALPPGERLPALHRLAGHAGVNVNTIRAVYRRLEQDGLVVTRHGSGTFVTGAPADPAALPGLVAIARDAARASGLDLRDVAAALYVEAAEPAPIDEAAAERRRLRAQIAALEQALSDLARRPTLTRPPADPPRRRQHARLLDVAGLADQRDALVRQLAEVQAGRGA